MAVKQKNSFNTLYPNGKALAWVVTVDMGYGHQRATYPLNDIAYQGIISANNYQGIPKADLKTWKSSQQFYEFVSRFKRVPIIGQWVFEAYNYLQRIKPFYPRRDLSEDSLQLKEMYHLIHRKQWGKNLIELLNQKSLPLVTSFFLPAFFAEEHGFKGDIYCIICDADMSRSWAALEPEKSRINYFAPNKRVSERLKLYGVDPSRIYLTGFPLPKENIGGSQQNILKADVGARIFNLDPKKYFYQKYHETLTTNIGKNNLLTTRRHPLSLTFAVGGAGAQRELGATIIDSLYQRLDKKDIYLYLVAGVRPEVSRFFLEKIKSVGLEKNYGKNIFIVYDSDKEKYFQKFNEVLHYTDILWTKPSELAFYSGLGLPIIMAEAIGSQEDFNRRWLLSTGAGFDQEDPRYTDQWLFDWIESGWLAEAALQGFLDAPKFGAYNIEAVLKHKHYREEKVQLL